MSLLFRGCLGALLTGLLAGPAWGANLLANANFDNSTSFWTTTPGFGGSIDLDPGLGSPAPASARITSDVAGAGASARFGQCVAVHPTWQYVAGAMALVGAGQATTGEARVYVVWYTSGNCAGGTALSATGSAEAATVGAWERLSTGRLRPPASARSLRFELGVKRDQASGEFFATFDSATLAATTRGDFNGDAKADLVLDDLSGNAHELWFMDTGMRLGSAPLGTTPPSDDWKLAGVEAFDLDDPDQDLVLRHQSTGELRFWTMNGTVRDQEYALSGASSPGTEWELASVGHFDSDRLPDLLWRNLQTQKLVVWKMNGFHKVGEIVPSPDQAVNSNWKVVATLDFDGDGATDFLWYNPDSGRIVFWFMDPNVVRLTGQFANPPSAGDNNWKVVAAGDYGVGPGGLADTNDVVWRNETSGNQVIWFMDQAGNRTSGAFTSPSAPTPPLGYTVVGPR